MTPTLIYTWGEPSYERSYRLVHTVKGTYEIEVQEKDLMGEPCWVQMTQDRIDLLVHALAKRAKAFISRELAGVPVSPTTRALSAALIVTAQDRKVLVPVRGALTLYAAVHDPYIGVQWVPRGDGPLHEPPEFRVVTILAMFFGGVQGVEVELVSEDGVHHLPKSQPTQKDRSLV